MTPYNEHADMGQKHHQNKDPTIINTYNHFLMLVQVP